jgi:hypothetical protein
MKKPAAAANLLNATLFLKVPPISRPWTDQHLPQAGVCASTVPAKVEKAGGDMQPTDFMKPNDREKKTEPMLSNVVYVMNLSRLIGCRDSACASTQWNNFSIFLSMSGSHVKT